jgi:hypothetical protein
MKIYIDDVKEEEPEMTRDATLHDRRPNAKVKTVQP